MSDSIPPITPALLRRTEAAAYCGRSAASWDRLVASGKTPKPIKLGIGVLFSRKAIDSWIAAGCPDRKTFDAISESEVSL